MEAANMFEPARFYAEFEKMMKESAKLRAEEMKLQAEREKLAAEREKLTIEALKMERERWWYPIVVAITSVGAGAALVLAITRFLG